MSKPKTGINTPELVKARLDALKVSPEACLAVIRDQLATFRASGAIAAPAVETVAPTAPTPAAPSIPAPPVVTAAPTPPAPPVDLLAGWTPNPANPDWYYRAGSNGQPEQKLKTDILAGR